jgi:hypothetical protein
MVRLLLTAPEWLPVAFDWAILPATLVLLALAFRGETRPLAARGCLIAATVTAALLSVLLAASIFHLLGYGRAVADLLLNFGPAMTRNYVATLLGENSHRLMALVPMIAALALSGVATMYLHRRRAP